MTEHTGSIEGNISVVVLQFSLLADGLCGVLADRYSPSLRTEKFSTDPLHDVVITSLATPSQLANVVHCDTVAPLVFGRDERIFHAGMELCTGPSPTSSQAMNWYLLSYIMVVERTIFTVERQCPNFRDSGGLPGREIKVLVDWMRSNCSYAVLWTMSTMRSKGDRRLTAWFMNMEDGCDPSHDDCPRRSISYFRTQESTPPLYRLGHTAHIDNVSNIPKDVRVFCTKSNLEDVCLCKMNQLVVLVRDRKRHTFAPRKV